MFGVIFQSHMKQGHFLLEKKELVLLFTKRLQCRTVYR